jgi:hypothetical protein
MVDGGIRRRLVVSGGWRRPQVGPAARDRQGGGEGKVQSTGGGSKARLTDRGGRRRLQIHRRQRCSDQTERPRGRGGVRRCAARGLA